MKFSTNMFGGRGKTRRFFTSFCNGTTSTCAGLSQWGTVSLADQGWSAVEILRNYYPEDIEIVETNIFSDIVETYPGTPLQLGSTGRDVESLQAYLTRIRNNYPGIPLITDSPGVFGGSTQAAVTTFQRIFNLAADGVVGRATWNRIISIYVAVARLTELDSEGTGLGIGTVPPNSVLQTGSSGIDVIILQYLLNYIGIFYPVIPPVTQDGRFGSGTAQAVTAFQQRMGLGADGVVGPGTWNALYSTYFSVKGTVPPPAPGPGPSPETTTHIVQAGDTLWLLAQRFNTTVAAIRALNNLTSDALRIGQVLQIPGTAPVVITHTVQAGDTLWLLAQRYGTTVAAIRALNNLTSDALMIGQVLQIPGTVPAPPPAFTHTVRAGDTLWLLAQRYGTTVAAIRGLNNLTSDALTIGQVLQIPGTAPALTHTVRAGDTLWLIAQRFNTTVAAIRALNNLTSDALTIGQVLLIP